MIGINNVVSISVSAPPVGVAPYSVNNLACFTKDSPVGSITGGYKAYTNTTEVSTDWGSDSNVYKAAVAVFAQSPNIVSGGGVFLAVPMVGDETLAAAVARILATVYFGGFSYTFAAAAEEVLEAATTAQSLRKIFGVVSSTSSDLDAAGLLNDIYAASDTYTRTLFHTVSAQKEGFKWGYLGRAMSTRFTGSNTTQSMHLKQISGVTADTGLTQTLLDNAEAVGADVYASIAGRPGVMSNGANEFFDNVYNLMWFLGALEVSVFNMLAQSSTKIPQTEAGVDIIKSAVREVCEQAVANRFIGPGSWTGADTFGDPEDFRRNITERGYYIYSTPIASQSAADRSARKCPLVQCGVKYQGAIHSADLLIYFNR